MNKILVTGAKGQGSELQVLSKDYSQFEWLTDNREELDLCDLRSI
jgi:dTDP-4-dehydrorhamnose reductase